MKLFILACLISTQTMGAIPGDWIRPGFQKGLSTHAGELSREDEASFQKIFDLGESLSNNEKKRHHYQLQRLDLEVGVGIEGEFGILAGGGESALELIWEREAVKQIDETEHEIVLAGTDTEEIAAVLEKTVFETLQHRPIRRALRKRMISFLRQDAEKIGLMVQDLLHMPTVGEWYVDGFFKTYYFSARGGILPFLSAGHDSRLRFHFKIARMPWAPQAEAELTSGQKFHHQFMSGLNQLGRLETIDSRFRLERVWDRTEVDKSLNLILFETMAGRGFQVVYRRNKENLIELEEFQLPNLNHNVFFTRPFVISHKLISAIPSASKGVLQLNQIRTKFSLEAELGIFLSTLGKASTLEMHFFRRRP
jgi:hypothetical protein